MRIQRRRLIGLIGMWFHLTPKHTKGVRRIVYAARCTAAHLKHGRGIEGDALEGRSVQTERWRTVARMIGSFSKNL